MQLKRLKWSSSHNFFKSKAGHCTGLFYDYPMLELANEFGQLQRKMTHFMQLNLLSLLLSIEEYTFQQRWHVKIYVGLQQFTGAILISLTLLANSHVAVGSDQESAQSEAVSKDLSSPSDSDSFSLGVFATDKVMQLRRLLRDRKEQAALAAFKLGIEAAHKNELEEAYKFISEAIMLDPHEVKYLQAGVELAFLKGDYEQAETLELVAIKIIRSGNNESTRELADLLDNLGTIYAAQEFYDEAEVSFRESLTLREQAFGDKHLMIAVSLNKLATLAVRQDHPAVAESLLKRSLDITREVSGPRHANSAAVLANLADLYQSESRVQEAEALYEEAISIWTDSPDDKQLRRAIGQNALGQLYLSQQRFDDARAQFEQVLSLLQADYAEDHPYVQQAMSNLTALDAELGSNDETDHMYEALVREFNQQLQRREAMTATIPAPQAP